jgi:hypothetical protein
MIFRRALEHDNLVLAEVTAREIGRVTIAAALELTALVARKQPERYGRFAARWLCLYLQEHEKATLDDVACFVPSTDFGSHRDDYGPHPSGTRVLSRGVVSRLKT